MGDAIALLPCPFCGSEAEFERTGTPRWSCIVTCGNCGCSLETSEVGAASGRAWNTRRDVAVERERVERSVQEAMGVERARERERIAAVAEGMANSAAANCISTERATLRAFAEEIRRGGKG